MTAIYRYGLLKTGERIDFVAMPATHMYQLTALFGRLHKEMEKLTAEGTPILPTFLAEFDNLELIDRSQTVWTGLDYINHLERTFAAINEKEYPLISLLTEIRALQAQLEQWYEEEAE